MIVFCKNQTTMFAHKIAHEDKKGKYCKTNYLITDHSLSMFDSIDMWLGCTIFIFINKSVLL